MKIVWSILITIALAVFFGLCLRGCANGIGPNYSSGERIGKVVKISHKGVIWKSWEGTMVLNDFDLGGVSVWDFSVVDDAVAKSIPVGTPVTVRYSQWWLMPISQDTNYTVTEVTPK